MGLEEAIHLSYLMDIVNFEIVGSQANVATYQKTVVYRPKPEKDISSINHLRNRIKHLERKEEIQKKWDQRKLYIKLNAEIPNKQAINKKNKL